MFLRFFSWWYGAGWLAVAESLGRRSHSLAEAFSVKSLLRTLFSPWKRVITYPGASLADKFHAFGDNLFSRIVGFFVRLSVLIGAGFSFLIVLAVTVLELLIWPLLPLSIIGFIVLAVAL